MMYLGVRTRVAVWLVLVALLVGASGLVLLDATQNRLERSAQESLVQLAQLERARLVDELDDTRVEVAWTANDPALEANYFEESPGSESDVTLADILSTARQFGQQFTAFRLIDREGTVLEQTPGFSWIGGDLAAESMDQSRTLIGPAIDMNTLGFVSPVMSSNGEVLGALLVETELAPILRLSNRYEAFGETNEAFIYQRQSDGSCQLLTNLRFDRSAAFSPIEGDFAAQCADLSTDRVLQDTDYRGIDTLSAWTSVPETDWGVVVKSDDSEVFALLNQTQRTILLSGLAAAIMLIGGWHWLVRPIGIRLSSTVEAAERLAAGNYNALIHDPRTDEIGRLSESMDRLAKDLARDIERRRVAEAQLRVRADFDDLTGLMNRHRTNDRMQELFEAGTDFSIIFLDLDGFKEINDTYGHSIGDAVLRLVASRTQKAIDHSKITAEVGRWGGDEFVVVCTEALQEDLTAFIDLIDRYFDAPFETSAGQHRIGVSVGSADSSNGDSPEVIMSAADASMYRMKRLRDGRTRVSPQAIQLVEEALENDRVQVQLQPLMSIDDRGAAHLFGAEALVRIQHEDGIFEHPDKFIPGLGSSKQAMALDIRTLQRAATATAELHRRGLVPADFYVSVNLGGAAMTDPRLVDKVLATIAQCELSPEHLVIEVPETAKEVDPGIIEQMRRRGIRTAIDDVGCQFSNLGRLVDIPADFAKIDRRWLPNAEPEVTNKLELLNGLVEQCRMLNLDVIVEGIETDTQLELVRSLGVDRVQGFLFGGPLELEKFERLWGRPGRQSLRVIYGLDDGRTLPDVNLV